MRQAPGVDPTQCAVCTEPLYAPMSCSACSFTVCVLCYVRLGRAPPACPVCRKQQPWMANRCVRDVLLSTPEYREAYVARHDQIAQCPISVLATVLKGIVPDAQVAFNALFKTYETVALARVLMDTLLSHLRTAPTEPIRVARFDAGRTVVTQPPWGAAAAQSSGTIAAPVSPGDDERAFIASQLYLTTCAAIRGDPRTPWIEIASPSMGRGIAYGSPPGSPRPPSDTQTRYTG